MYMNHQRSCSGISRLTSHAASTEMFQTHLHNRTGLPTPRKGVVTVELAMVLPIIFLFFFLALELASINFARQTLGYAAYEAARKSSIPGVARTIGEDEAMRQMNLVGLGEGAVIEIDNSEAAVTATITLPSSGFSWGPVGYFGSYTIRESCTVMKE